MLKTQHLAISLPIRDLWNQITSEDVKKDIIRQHLKIQRIDEILNQPTIVINKQFGVTGNPSNKFVQYPGKWAIVNYNENFPDKDDFLKICRFKWSFNIKPDIVIHLDKEQTICIEAKYESGEGTYPVSEIEKKIFSKRNIPFVKQMKLQKYMMEDLLGLKTDFRYIVFKKSKSDTHQVMSWADAFGCMNLNYLPEFAKEMVKRISKQKEQTLLDTQY